MDVISAEKQMHIAYWNSLSFSHKLTACFATFNEMSRPDRLLASHMHIIRDVILIKL